jgi:hypothetical protein
MGSKINFYITNKLFLHKVFLMIDDFLNDYLNYVGSFFFF